MQDMEHIQDMQDMLDVQDTQDTHAAVCDFGAAHTSAFPGRFRSWQKKFESRQPLKTAPLPWIVNLKKSVYSAGESAQRAVGEAQDSGRPCWARSCPQDMSARRTLADVTSRGSCIN